MGRPAVKGTVDKTARPIRTSMINQSADNAQTPVGIAFLEDVKVVRLDAAFTVILCNRGNAVMLRSDDGRFAVGDD